MKLVVPEYFDRFKCIADSCTDNCCIGWEIGIDSKTLEKYRKVEGELGCELAEKIKEDEYGAQFILDGERCPFLDGCGLCRLITNLGEGYLSEICREHPRYYSVFSDVAFGGIGLSCEEAASLILSEEEDHTYIEREAEGFEPSECDCEMLEFLLEKKAVFLEILCNRELSIKTRMKYARDLAFETQSAIDPFFEADGCECESVPSISEYFAEMEHLTPELGELLARADSAASAKKQKNAPERITERYLENIFVYFMDRYLTDAAHDGNLVGRILLAAISTAAIMHIFESEDDLTLKRAVEIAKCYSKEIEYSEENVERIIENEKLTDAVLRKMLFCN